jgi:precorrin-2 methylase
MILATRTDFVLYFNVVQKHVAAAASGHLNVDETFLNLHVGIKLNHFRCSMVGGVGYASSISSAIRLSTHEKKR